VITIRDDVCPSTVRGTGRALSKRVLHRKVSSWAGGMTGSAARGPAVSQWQ
jgi:hypothetical protein